MLSNILLIKSISNNRQNPVYIQPSINETDTETLHLLVLQPKRFQITIQVLLIHFDRICALMAYCLPVAQH